MTLSQWCAQSLALMQVDACLCLARVLMALGYQLLGRAQWLVQVAQDVVTHEAQR